MAVCIEFHDDDYIMWRLDFSEQLIDGEREQGCWVQRFTDDNGDILLDNMYIIAKGNILETIEAKW